MYLLTNVFLFNSVVAARDIADILREEWDGCNGVAIKNPDLAALETAAELLEAEYCFDGDNCYLSKTIQSLRNDERNLQKHSVPLIIAKTRSGKSILLGEYMMRSRLDPQLHNHRLEINFLRQRNEEH